jgi:hypothetical protein
VASLPIGPAPHQFCGHRIFTADNGVHRDVDMRRTLDLARDDARGRPAHLGSNRCTKIVLQKKCWFHQMDRTSKAFGKIAAFTVITHLSNCDQFTFCKSYVGFAY